jgi:thymidylate synthase
MLKPSIIEAYSLEDFYFQTIYEAVKTGQEITINKPDVDDTMRWQLDFLFGHIKCPGSKPLLPQMPEALSIPNPVDENYINNNLQYYMTDIINPNEEYTYGQFLSWQIEWCIEHYKKYPTTRHCYMQVGKPEMLYYYDLTPPEHTPCLRGVDTFIKNESLGFHIHFRSWNIWSAMPANLACLQLVKEYMADEIGVQDGEIFVTCAKAGLSSDVFQLAQERTHLNRNNEYLKIVSKLKKSKGNGN